VIRGAPRWPGLAMFLAFAPVLASGQAPAVVIRADRILDGRSGILQGTRWIVVEGDRIARVLSTRPEGSVPTYDLTGLTVLPGLIDVHDHIGWHFNRDGRTHTESDGETPAESALAGAGNAWRTLQAGFTTVQSPGSASDRELRDAIAAGAIPGPRVLTSLEPLNEKSGDPDQLRALVRQRAGSGADVIKLFASKSIRDGGAQTMTREQLEAACGEARARGLRTLVHAHSAESMRAAAEAGCTEIEHGVFATDDVLKLLAERGTYFDPQCCLVFRNYLENKSRFLGIGNYTEEGFAAMEKALPLALATFRRALATPGLRIVFGTDAVAGAHGENVREIICRVVEGGQKPMDAIVSATSLGARSLGLSERIGAVAPGLDADLIAVEGNPAEDIRALSRVVFVMKGGRVYKSPPVRARPTVDRVTARARGSYSAPSFRRISFRRSSFAFSSSRTSMLSVSAISIRRSET
jgi:imidazolonepropionase-like amidohydrolase